jgi:preprotein translocase subunit SecE
MAEKKEVATATSRPAARPPAARPPTGSLWSELFQLSVYKRSQGRIARQVTFAALMLLFAVGCWRLSTLLTADAAITIGVPLALFAVGIWFAFRLVNTPRFADFLIAVEAEMYKVSWPSRSELIRSSIVVIVVLLMLTAVLFVYDIVWQWLFRVLGILG